MSEAIMRMRRNKAAANRLPSFAVGQKADEGGSIHGGGGPENVGAKSSDRAQGVPFTENQPSWSWEDHTMGEYLGPAAPTNKPNLAGIPSNSQRALGDYYGGRQ
jgi:hypothetical protein